MTWVTMTQVVNPLAESVGDDRFLEELHAFLWTDEFVNNGEIDGGWSCRDHAVVVGGYLALAGAQVRIRHGRNMFVAGPGSDGAPPMGLGQNDLSPARVGHSWLWVDGLGDVDVSPKLHPGPAGWRPIRAKGVIGSAWDVRDGSAPFLLVTSPDAYERQVALATRAVDERHAIYWLMREEPLTADIVLRGLSWSNSRVSLRLLNRRMPDDLYARFAAHLQGVVNGTRRSLRRVSVNKAWSTIASEPEL